MSRSRRRSPCHAVTMARSEKAYKQAEHRRERRTLRALDLTQQEPPVEKTFGSPWDGEKDGKFRFNPAMHPHLMRK